MEKQFIKIKTDKGEVLIKTFSFLDRSSLLIDKVSFIQKICNDIKESGKKGGFAGFKNEQGFKEHLKYFIFKDSINKKYPESNCFLNTCINLIKETINKISKFLTLKEIEIYIFPTLSKFTIEKMKGASGRWIWGNIIYIDIFPIQGWEKYFEGALIHEITHLLQKHYSSELSIGEGLILDGIAENFQEIFTGMKNPWTTILPKEEALKIFKEIKPIINKKDLSLYDEIFYGTGKYSLWTGYAIGYHLIKDYIKKNKLSWKELFEKKPEEIINSLKE